MSRLQPLLTNGFIRVSQCRHGPMLYNINDQYIGRQLDLYGEFHEQQAALFRQVVKPGQLVVDVGANIGGHTIPLAHHVGSQGGVIAIEPQRISHTMLCANVALNALRNVWAIFAASGSKLGSVRVPVVDPNIENNFGALSLIKFHNTGDRVQVIPLDQYSLPTCAFIKVDVEGMELDVLQGAVKTITRCRPIMFVENDRAESSAELISFLFGLNYRLWWHRTPYFDPNNFYGETANVFEKNIESRNILCVHKDMSVPVDLPEITRADDWPLRAL